MTGGGGNGQGGGAAPPVSATENPSALKTPPPVGLGTKTVRPGDTAGGLVGPAKRAGTPWTAVALAVIAALVLALGLIAVVAGPSQHLLAGHPGVLRRRPRTATVAIVGVAAAALVALALYRLLARTSGLNLGVGWATVGIAFGATAGVALITPAVFRLVLRRWRWMRADDDAGRAHAAWREFHDDLADFGVTSRPSEPPRTLAARVTNTLADPAPARGAPPPAAGRGAGQLRRPSHRIAAPAPGRNRRTPRPGRERTPVNPMARDRLPRLDDDRPRRSGRAGSRPDHDAEVQAPHAVQTPGAARPARRARAARPATPCRPPAGAATAPPSAPSSGPAWSAPRVRDRRGLRVQAAPGP